MLEQESETDIEALTPREVFDAVVRSRRSVCFFSERDVPTRVLEQALALSVFAPNHFHTHPWRFMVYSGAARVHLAKAFEVAASQVGWSTQHAQSRAYDAPVSIVIGCVPTTGHPRVRPMEEEFSVAAATQNLMLALVSHGLDSALTTGQLQRSREVEADAGIVGGRVVGVLKVGYRDAQRELLLRPEPTTAGVVRWR